jgi:hypothetical protein
MPLAFECTHSFVFAFRHSKLYCSAQHVCSTERSISKLIGPQPVAHKNAQNQRHTRRTHSLFLICKFGCVLCQSVNLKSSVVQLYTWFFFLFLVDVVVIFAQKTFRLFMSTSSHELARLVSSPRLPITKFAHIHIHIYKNKHLAKFVSGINYVRTKWSKKMNNLFEGTKYINQFRK